MNVLSLITSLLPIGEEIASIFIHNPNSQHQFSMVVGTVNELLPVVSAITQSAAAPAASAAPAAEPVIPAGVPSAH